jgi:hypothetical protein
VVYAEALSRVELNPLWGESLQVGNLVLLVHRQNGAWMFIGAASSGVNEVAGTCLHPAIRA